MSLIYFRNIIDSYRHWFVIINNNIRCKKAASENLTKMALSMAGTWLTYSI